MTAALPGTRLFEAIGACAHLPFLTVDLSRIM